MAILGILFIIIICCGIILGAIFDEYDTPSEKRKKEERKKAWFELYYDDSKKEYEFWTYFRKRKRGKLLYIVPEFEQRIVKMNKLKKGRD